MAGHSEQRAGAVIHQHEIGDVDRQPPASVEWVDRLEAGRKALFLLGLELGRGGPAALAFGDELGRLGLFLGDQRCQRMIGGDRDEARSEQGVGPGGEDLDRPDRGDRLGQAETELEASAAADPIGLHHPDLVGPIVERLQPF